MGTEKEVTLAEILAHERERFLEASGAKPTAAADIEQSSVGATLYGGDDEPAAEHEPEHEPEPELKKASKKG